MKLLFLASSDSENFLNSSRVMLPVFLPTCLNRDLSAAYSIGMWYFWNIFMTSASSSVSVEACTAVVFVEFVENGFDDEVYFIFVWGGAVLERQLFSLAVLPHPHDGIPILQFASSGVIDVNH
jgi:hypothetical protein